MAAADTRPTRRLTGLVACVDVLLVAGSALLAQQLAVHAVRASWADLQLLLVAFNALLLARLVPTWLSRPLGRGAVRTRSVAVVGHCAHARNVLAQIAHAPGTPYRAACVFDEAGEAPRWLGNVPVCGDFAEFSSMVRARAIDEIWLAVPLAEQHVLRRFVREFRNDFVDIRYMPDLRGVPHVQCSVDKVLGYPTLNLAMSPAREYQLWPKEVFDRIAAAIALVVLLPLFLVVAVMVKRSSPGPVLFRQRRKGYDGREFEIFKFRTMCQHEEVPGVLTQARRGDPRVTKVGAVLRALSIDELPQLLNVLRGQMSLVGPRPHALAHDDLYKNLVEGYMHRYRIRPGLTGWAQVNGYRGETSTVEKMEARVKFDLFYIRNWSFWFDLQIILRTPACILLRRNAY
ncbi:MULTISPECIES: undecaprenyl-phosphate glucose phosphotransferase [unclassified Cupriavidus]|uniref:undecaprenyl-phosphate glucose phosphotransferase n=1 Tax=Cupriavidus sp. H19C3 TaxID=3241603 RepID=UPI003BF92827